MRDFNYTINVLVKAYITGELKHGNCAFCAVGNIVHEATGFSQCGDEEIHYSEKRAGVWVHVFSTPTRTGEQRMDLKKYSNEYPVVKEAIDRTGYTVHELARIEYAFEMAPRNCHYDDGDNEEWMFNGLMAVVDVLADIHNIDLSVREEAKLLFVKA